MGASWVINQKNPWAREQRKVGGGGGDEWFSSPWSISSEGIFVILVVLGYSKVLGVIFHYPNIEKKFMKHFQECNQKLKIFYIEKHSTSKKSKPKSTILPNFKYSSVFEFFYLFFSK